MQVRYVVTRTEEEIDIKMENYKEELANKGCAELNWVADDYDIEIDEVVY